MPFGLPPIILVIGIGVAFAFGAFVYSLIPVKSDIARRLDGSSLELQIIAICGRNKELEAEMRAVNSLLALSAAVK